MPRWGAPYSAIVRPDHFGVVLLQAVKVSEAIRRLLPTPQPWVQAVWSRRDGQERWGSSWPLQGTIPNRQEGVQAEREPGQSQAHPCAGRSRDETLTSGGGGLSSASVWQSSPSSGGSGLGGGGCCHTIASWACCLRYRSVRWVRLARLTTFLGRREKRESEGKGSAGRTPPAPSYSAPSSAGTPPGLTTAGPSRGGACWGRRSPAAAGAGGAAAQQGALAALGAQEGVVLVLQLQQLGPHLLVPTHI